MNNEQPNDGVALIQKERREQIEKHGRTIADDQLQNGDGQLWEAAVFCITDQTLQYPEDWATDFKTKIRQKRRIERLAVAGALIAAEIDRLIANGQG